MYVCSTILTADDMFVVQEWEMNEIMNKIMKE